MVDLGTVQINELSEIDKKFSQHHSYCDVPAIKTDSYLNIGLQHFI